MTAERTADRPRPADLEVGDPDIDFRLGVGVYVGAVALGSAATAAAWADPSAAAAIALLAATGVLGAVFGAVVAGRLPELAVAVGCRRRRRLAPLLPAVAFGLLGAAALLEPAAGGGMVLAAIFAAGVTAGAGLLVAVMAQNRYVAAVVDEPRATWTWSRAGPFRWEYATGATFLAMALWGAARGDWVFTLMWAGYAAFWLLIPFLEGRWADPDELGTVPELSVHDVGLVKSRGRTKSLVPWDAITGVRLTDDELVLERRFRDVRCKRDAIEDPESVLEAIERVRSRAAGR